MVSVGLEDVRGHLSVVTDVTLDLLKLLLLKGQICCLRDCNGFQLHQQHVLPYLQCLHQLLKGLYDGQFSFLFGGLHLSHHLLIGINGTSQC